MSWKNEIKKEKYQGPQQQYGRFVMVHNRLMDMERTITYLEKEIAKPSEISKNMIENYVKDLRRNIDAFDKELIEVAKYGGSLANLPVDRKDSKYISNYGAKYRLDIKDGV